MKGYFARPTSRDRMGFVSLCGLVAMLLLSPLVVAQHEMHNMSASTQVTTMPENDAVLVKSPESIMLHFESEVRLATLALKEPSQGKEIIDIGFRYHPATGVHFVQPLPALPAADYYVVEWAAIDAKGLLMKGTFYFSFGENAKPPSSFRQGMEHTMPLISPDYRLQ